jgi:SAM-dependent methyltransferase
MSLEENVAQHYASSDLFERILDACRAAGADPDHLTIDDLKPVDEFHTGGIEATTSLLDQLEITPEMVVVDLGCGLGGTARHIVHRYGAMVKGVDLTPDYVATGQALNAKLFLSERIELKVGSATHVPFADGIADLVTLFHVGMNIADKGRLFAEAARLLKPGGHFALFDVMRDSNPDPLVFPVPWAGSGVTSHVDAPEVYRDGAAQAGLVQTSERERRQFALDFFGRVFARLAAKGPPPLGLHLLMGANAGEKMQNYVANVEAERIAPVEMIFQRP